MEAQNRQHMPHAIQIYCTIIHTRWPLLGCQPGPGSHMLEIQALGLHQVQLLRLLPARGRRSPHFPATGCSPTGMSNGGSKPTRALLCLRLLLLLLLRLLLLLLCKLHKRLQRLHARLEPQPPAEGKQTWHCLFIAAHTQRRFEGLTCLLHHATSKVNSMS